MVSAMKMKDHSLIRQHLTVKVSVINSITTKAAFLSFVPSKPDGGKFCFTFFLLFYVFLPKVMDGALGGFENTAHTI